MSHSVLVIDDDAELRATLRAVLETAGYEVDVAKNGLEGLEHFEHHKPCLILLDLMMPVMSGPEFLEELRCRPDAVPVVVVSAFEQTFDASTGVAGVLRKPCNIDNLIAAAARYCGLCQAAHDC